MPATHENYMKIEKNITMPLPGRGRPRKYPFLEMQLGDSFWSDGVSIRACASQAGKDHNMKFTTRKDGEGIRVWRTA